MFKQSKNIAQGLSTATIREDSASASINNTESKTITLASKENLGTTPSTMHLVYTSLKAQDLNKILKKFQVYDQSLPTVETALRRAVTLKSSIADIEFLCNKVSDINAQDDNLEKKKTALHWACEKKHWEIAEFLIQKGAKLDIEDANKKTALSYIQEAKVEYVLKKENKIAQISSSPSMIMLDSAQKEDIEKELTEKFAKENKVISKVLSMFEGRKEFLKDVLKGIESGELEIRSLVSSSEWYDYHKINSGETFEEDTKNVFIGYLKPVIAVYEHEIITLILKNIKINEIQIRQDMVDSLYLVVKDRESQRCYKESPHFFSEQFKESEFTVKVKNELETLLTDSYHEFEKLRASQELVSKDIRTSLTIGIENRIKDTEDKIRKLMKISSNFPEVISELQAEKENLKNISIGFYSINQNDINHCTHLLYGSFRLPPSSYKENIKILKSRKVFYEINEINNTLSSISRLISSLLIIQTKKEAILYKEKTNIIQHDELIEKNENIKISKEQQKDILDEISENSIDLNFSKITIEDFSLKAKEKTRLWKEEIKLRREIKERKNKEQKEQFLEYQREKASRNDSLRQMTDSEREFLISIDNKLNKTAHLNLENLFMESPNLFKDICFADIKMLVEKCDGKLEFTNGSHFSITLPNTYRTCVLSENIIEYGFTKGGSYKPHGGENWNRSSNKYCRDAFIRAGITPDRIKMALTHSAQSTARM